MTNLAVRDSVVLRVLVALISFAAAAVTHAQNATVTAANASNDVIYDVSFNTSGGGTTTTLNTDAGSLHHIVSLVFVPNTSTFVLDLLAADNQGGLIVRYPGDFHAGDPTTGTVAFSYNGAGPAYPDGLSVDGAGDLYVVNSAPGSASAPELWVLPANGTGGFGTPVSIDANYASTETLVDTLVATSTIVPPGGTQPVVYPGDVLVVTSNPSEVLRYAATNGVSPLSATTPTVLVTLPAGAIPGGIAFWPADNSLLVSTSRGTIYQYHLTPNETPTTFASGLGNGQFKVRTGVQSGAPYAYVANNNGGDILEFSAPNQLIATVTAGVQHPQGLAVTNVAYAALSTCQNQQTNGCDLLGGQLITHVVPANLPKPASGNVVEDVCVVQVDPRLLNGGSCSTAPPLPVSQVCGNFRSSATIPPTLCGASGPSGKGFALIKTLTQAESSLQTYPFNGTLILTDSNLTSVLPGSANPVCNPPGPGTPPLGTLAWAPLLPSEGIVVEGNGKGLVELTDGCDGAYGHQAGLSLVAVGLALNTSSLPSYTDSKYQNVLATLTSENGSGALPGASFPPENFTYQLQECIQTSQAAFDTSNSFYAGAALQVLAADQQVASSTAPFTQVANYPNPSGALRSRLLSLYYTINTRLIGNPGNPAPSPPPAPPAPQITGTPAQSAKAMTFYSFTPGAADFTGINHGTLRFSIVGQPSWATFDPMTGTLSGYTVKGKYPGIVITVTDGCATDSLPTFSINVK